MTSGVPKSEYRGVNWCGESKRWHAVLRVGGKKISLKRHMTEEAAGLAFDKYFKGLIKRFQREINFPDRVESEIIAQSDQVEAHKVDNRLIHEDPDIFGPNSALDKDSVRGDVILEGEDIEDDR